MRVHSAKYKVQSGQALVLVLLSLAVVLTLVLFILARSITDIAVSSREEEAVRAFSAAEAGVEKALIAGSSSGLTQIGDATFNATVSSFAAGVQAFTYPMNVSSGDSVTLWFVNHDTDGNIECSGANPCFTGSKLKICWGKAGTSSAVSVTPAVEVSFFYVATPGDYSTMKIARVAFDPNSGRRSSNFFAAPDAGTCTIDGETFEFQKTIDVAALSTPIPASSYSFQNGLQFARVRMLYNTDTDHKVGFDVNFAGNSALPSQGQQIDSTGTAGEANRRIAVFQGWPEPPSVFDYAVYSSTGLTK